MVLKTVFKPVLCRPYRGQTKGKVERTVAFVKDNFIVGIKYSSLNFVRYSANLCFRLQNYI